MESKRKSKESAEKTYQLSSCELDSSSTSYTSCGSRGSLCCIRKPKGVKRNGETYRDLKTSSESELSCNSHSSDIESCSLSEEDGSSGHGGYTSCASPVSDGDSSSSGCTSNSLSDLTSSSNSPGSLSSEHSSASISISQSSTSESWASSEASSESEMDSFSATFHVGSASSTDEFADPCVSPGRKGSLKGVSDNNSKKDPGVSTTHSSSAANGSEIGHPVPHNKAHKVKIDMPD